MRGWVSWKRGHGGPTASADEVVASRLLWRAARAPGGPGGRQESTANSPIYAPFPGRRPTLAQGPWGINRRRPDRDPELDQAPLHLGHGGLAEVEDRGCERGLGVAPVRGVGEGGCQVVGAATAPRGDHRH